MNVSKHVIYTAIAAAGLSVVAKTADVAVFVLTSIFIDADHYFEYVVKKGRYSLKEAYYWCLGRHHEYLKDPRYPVVLNIFHTVEVFSFLAVMGAFYQVLWLILLGFTFHLLLDGMELYKRDLLGLRAVSIFQYCFIKRIPIQ